MDLTNEQEPVETEGERLASYANEEVELFGVMLGALTNSDVTHQAVRSAVLPKIYELMKEITELRELLQVSSETEDEMQREIYQQDTEITQLKTAKYEAELLASDRDTKLKNCYNELVEARNNIDELNAKLVIATTPKTPVRTNVDGAEIVKKEKRAIYDVEHISHARYKAKFADTDEAFEDWTIYKDVKYQEVTAEEAPSFRTVQEPVLEDDKRGSEVEAEPVVIPSVDDEPSENTFREEEDTIGSELATESPSVAGIFITEERFQSVEERLASVESDLTRIKSLLKQ